MYLAMKYATVRKSSEREYLFTRHTLRMHLQNRLFLSFLFILTVLYKFLFIKVKSFAEQNQIKV